MGRRIGIVVALVALSGAGAGCTTDCDVLCRTRAECYETGETESECVARCADESVNPDDADRVAACAECVDGVACEEVMDRCLTDCL